MVCLVRTLGCITFGSVFIQGIAEASERAQQSGDGQSAASLQRSAEELAAAQARVAELEGSLSGAGAQLAELEGRLASAVAMAEAASARTAALEAAQVAGQQRLQELEGRLADAEAAAATAAEAKAEAAEAAVSAMQPRLEELQASLTAAEQQAANFGAGSAALQAEAAEARSAEALARSELAQVLAGLAVACQPAGGAGPAHAPVTVGEPATMSLGDGSDNSLSAACKEAPPMQPNPLFSPGPIGDAPETPRGNEEAPPAACARQPRSQLERELHEARQQVAALSAQLATFARAAEVAAATSADAQARATAASVELAAISAAQVLVKQAAQTTVAEAEARREGAEMRLADAADATAQAQQHALEAEAGRAAAEAAMADRAEAAVQAEDRAETAEQRAAAAEQRAAAAEQGLAAAREAADATDRDAREAAEQGLKAAQGEAEQACAGLQEVQGRLRVAERTVEEGAEARRALTTMLEEATAGAGDVPRLQVCRCVIRSQGPGTCWLLLVVESSWVLQCLAWVSLSGRGCGGQGSKPAVTAVAVEQSPALQQCSYEVVVIALCGAQRALAAKEAELEAVRAGAAAEAGLAADGLRQVLLPGSLSAVEVFLRSRPGCT